MAIKFFKKKKSKEEPDQLLPDAEPAAEAAEEDASVQVPEEEPPESAVQEERSEAEAETGETAEKNGIFSKLRKGLSKTREILTTDVDELFMSGRKIDDALFEELEELLIASDIGVRTAIDLMDKIAIRSSKIKNAQDLKAVLKEEILALIDIESRETPEKHVSKPHVILIVGVNGTGKTTTIGKLAARYTGEGKKVLIAAGDTFRAAASEQLTVWAQRAGADIVSHRENSDPAAVAYDSVEAAIARNVDVVLVDTAGRLQTKVNLMEELKKINRAIAKKLPDAPHETLIVLDATTGQNAMSQATLFNEAVGVSGIALTKLDGTAKGGIVIAIAESLNIPIKYIGIGEQIDDLQDFDPQAFVEALF